MNLSTTNKQSGAVLMVALIMLLLLTLIGMAAIRGSTLQERMAGNMRDRNVAFQSAEAGLRSAEAVLNGAAIPNFSGATKGYGQPVTAPGNASFWDKTFDWGNQALQTALNITYVKSQPQYYVEQVMYTAGNDPGAGIDLESSLRMETGTVYRVTSRAEGGSADTVVILQSTYKRGD